MLFVTSIHDFDRRAFPLACTTYKAPCCFPGPFAQSHWGRDGTRCWAFVLFPPKSWASLLERTSFTRSAPNNAPVFVSSAKERCSEGALSQKIRMGTQSVFKVLPVSKHVRASIKEAMVRAMLMFYHNFAEVSSCSPHTLLRRLVS